MLLIETDGKALFAEHGIPIPAGVVVTEAGPRFSGDGPWMVKAQVPVGGRGKAGGIVRCASPADVQAAVARMLRTRLKGHTVEACLVEAVATGQERYLAVMVDPASYGLRVIYSARGGIEIEASGSAETRLCQPQPESVTEALKDLIAGEPDAWRNQVAAIGTALATLLLEKELALAEINPLFVAATGCMAGDAKVVVDLNAVDRQPRIAALVANRPAIYADACRKMQEGFDYVELDPEGQIGLITTGAGLSMMLIDELTARGAKPVNFCDIRTSQMRGSPVRLMRVLEWITARSSLKAVLVNIFAGITDLAEFAGLLAAAVQASPSLRVPIVTRLVGRNAAEAQRILGEAQPGMLVTEDLEEALSRIDAIVGAAS